MRCHRSGVYGVGPYLLPNYNDTLDALSTFAHEAGHAMHTVLSYESQPFVNSGYTIFVAEVASTTNERFLLNKLLQTTIDPKERFLLLEHAYRPARPRHLYQNFTIRARIRSQSHIPWLTTHLEWQQGSRTRSLSTWNDRLQHYTDASNWGHETESGIRTYTDHGGLAIFRAQAWNLPLSVGR